MISGPAGGFIAGLPSTLAVALVFIGWNQSVAQVVQVTTTLPLSYGVTCAFPIFYAVIISGGIAKRLSLSVLLWLGVSTLVTFLNPRNFFLSIAGAVVICLITYFGITRRLKVQTTSSIRNQHTRLELLVRACLGGLVVLSAVVVSEIGGPLLGSVFSAFPAVFSSSLVLASKRSGLEHVRSMAMAMMVTASMSVLPYIIAARYLFPEFGFIWGAIASYGVALVGAMIAFVILHPTAIDINGVRRRHTSFAWPPIAGFHHACHKPEYTLRRRT